MQIGVYVMEGTRRSRMPGSFRLFSSHELEATVVIASTPGFCVFVFVAGGGGLICPNLKGALYMIILYICFYKVVLKFSLNLSKRHKYSSKVFTWSNSIAATVNSAWEKPDKRKQLLTWGRTDGG